MTNQIQQLKSLPEKLEIKAYSNQILLTDTLQNTEIDLGESANLTLIAIIKKGWREKQTLNFNFKNRNATLNFLALIVGSKDEAFPFETYSNHTATNTNAYYDVRSALFDKSNIDYKGNLIIKPTGQITDSYLEHHSLMLSKDARVQTIPSLEIEADDVKAGHAATMSTVDDELLFYLQSRGLDKTNSKQLLIKNFFERNLEKIDNEKAKRLITEKIEEYLNQCSSLKK